MVFRVVSLPPTISRMTFPWKVMKSMSRVAGLCAIIEIRSMPGSALTRSSHSPLKAVKHSIIASLLCCQLFTGPWPGWFMIMSDHQGSLRRCSNGKSNSVASVIAVSSFDTRSTQSNSSPIGSESRIAPARSRTSGDILPMLEGASVGLTALRAGVCSGSSMVMKPAPPRRWGISAPGFASCQIFSCSAMASRFGSVMPLADEKASWLVSTAMMSSQVVTDQ